MKTEEKKKSTPNIILYYCKSLKNEGKPIIVKNLDTNSDYATDEVYLENVDIRMKYNNVPKDDKDRGVTTVLEIFKRWIGKNETDSIRQAKRGIEKLAAKRI